AQLKEQRLPTARELDQFAPVNPVVLVRGGHEYILNSAALAHWKITKTTPAPAGGQIGKEADGELNGELVDNARGLATLPSARAPAVENPRAPQRWATAYAIPSGRVPGRFRLGEVFQVRDPGRAAPRPGPRRRRRNVARAARAAGIRLRGVAPVGRLRSRS